MTEIEPAIWRRIQMPGDCTFWDLHVAIQNAMGWLDCHLHMFHVTDPTTGQPELIGRPDEEGLLEEDIVSGWKRLVAQRLSVAHSRLEYVYDFGDDWQHAVVLEEQLPSVPQVRYPRCIGGARACPPEDSGGVCGYRELLAALADPHHEEHAGYREWVGEEYDSERFDPQSVKFEIPQQRWNYVFDDGEDVWDEGPPWVPGATVIEGEAEGVVAGPWQGTGAQVDAGPDMVDPLAVAGTTPSTSEEWLEIAESPIEEVPSGAEFYDPAHVPDPDEWLELSDDDRIALVREHHEAASTEPPNAFLHATFHVVVETQLARADPPEVVETMARLLRQGLDRQRPSRDRLGVGSNDTHRSSPFLPPRTPPGHTSPV